MRVNSIPVGESCFDVYFDVYKYRYKVYVFVINKNIWPDSTNLWYVC